MKNLNLIFVFLLISFSYSCSVSKNAKITVSNDDGIIDMTFLQINDVYEIAPLEGGKKGGMARVATLKKQLQKDHPNMLTVLSGDFLNPSVIGTIKYKGKRIKGAHMIDVMNALGVDLVTFGNHEFDLSPEELQDRLNESESLWLGTNVLFKNKKTVRSFYQGPIGIKEHIPSLDNKYIQEMYIWDIEDQDGTKAKIGFFGVTINSNPVDYVIYEDFRSEAIKAYQFLSKHTDLVVGITHLEIGEDLELAGLIQDVPLFMGGHEHVNMIEQVGNVMVAKADANAKSAYVHHLKLNLNTKKTELKSELVQLDEKIALDPEVTKVVEKWNKISSDIYSKEGFDINEVLLKLETPLDGREVTIRHKQTNLGELIARAISSAYSEDDAAILNSGTIRIDDQISGQLTQFDIIRAMPFGGGIVRINIKGDLLKAVLDKGIEKPGNGSFLQLYNIKRSGADWKLKGQLIDSEKSYNLVMNDFLLRGLDIPILKEGVPGILKIESPKEKDIKRDIRLVVIDYLKNK